MVAGDIANISDGVVRLRDVSQADVDLLYVWRMEESSRLMFRHTEVVPIEFHRAIVERHLRGESADRWFIIEAAGKPAGTVSLYNFCEDGRVCEWGRFVIAPEARNLGYGRRALRLLMRYARAAGVERMKCDVLAGNAAALRLYRDLGFTKIEVHDCGGRTFLTMAADLDSGD